MAETTTAAAAALPDRRPYIARTPVRQNRAAYEVRVKYALSFFFVLLFEAIRIMCRGQSWLVFFLVEYAAIRMQIDAEIPLGTNPWSVLWWNYSRFSAAMGMFGIAKWIAFTPLNGTVLVYCAGAELAQRHGGAPYWVVALILACANAIV